ncbi:hypothetical protein Bca4012_087883 [Brassica carinata]
MLNESVVFIKVIYSHELSVSLSLQSLHSELYFRFINKRVDVVVIRTRCSLFRLFHKSGPRKQLDERRRLSMAYDVLQAKGMNYLHNHNPLIVHRDLKSPNLLVDKKYTVKVCDLGLSVKGQDVSFIKPEWMSPEVMRDEHPMRSQPCTVLGSSCGSLLHCRNHGGTLNLAQVVASGGFKNKRLEIPWNLNLNPQIRNLEVCVMQRLVLRLIRGQWNLMQLTIDISISMK